MTEVKSMLEGPDFTTDIQTHTHAQFELPLAAVRKLRQLTCCLQSRCLTRQRAKVCAQKTDFGQNSEAA